MADDSAQNRHLPASERKIRKARAEGQVPRSRDLGHFGAFFAAGLLAIAVAPDAIAVLKRLVMAGLTFDAQALAEAGTMVDHLARMGLFLGLAAGAVGVVTMLVALACGVLAGGWNFTWTAVRPDLGRVNPFAGLPRMWSRQQIGNTLKACLLALVLVGVAAWYLAGALPRFVQAGSVPLPAALAQVGDAVAAGVVLLLVTLGLFALVDVPLQRHLFLARLRMSADEVKREMKDVEGNTEVKGKMKLRMRELANRRMLAAVPRSDLVVMNPSHFAVALRYDEASMAAPRVVAKGADLMAFRIRDAAKAARVPVLQAPPLARALYAHAEVDREIPAALFAAVAQLLAWVYQLRASMAGQAAAPGEPPVPAIPEGLDPGSAPAAAEAE
jgi:flagellar biosynthetic protein FlhB